MRPGGPEHPLRRVVLGLFAAVALPVRAAQPARLTMLDAPQPIAQIHVTADERLLAVSTAGTLWSRGAGRWTSLGEQLDPRAPIASGHGRVAGRAADGNLWLLDAGKRAAVRNLRLAPFAGMLILPFGVIAIAQDEGGSAYAVRLEPQGATWSETARGGEAVLPDARLLQTDLDAQGDAGHVVLLAGPDTRRVTHAVLGDGIEATRLLYLERHSLAPMRGVALPEPFAFEDIAPRAIPWRGRPALVCVRSGPQGAQLALFAADHNRRDALAVVALGPPIGTANRWMAPVTDGRRLLAVHTPHIGGLLHEYTADGDRLVPRIVARDLCNHALGSRELDLSAWAAGSLLVPSGDRRRLRVLDADAHWAERAWVALPSAVVASRPLGLDGRAGAALLLEGGAVAWAGPGA